MAVDWDTWQQQMRSGGFGTTAIPGMEGAGMASPMQAWAGWELGQPQQTTNWGQVGFQAENPYPQPSGPWTSLGGNPFGMEYAQQGPPPSTPSGIDPTYAQGNAPQETTYTIPGTLTAPPTAASMPWLTPAQAATGTGQSGQEQVQNTPVVGTTGGGTGAAWQGQDYKLPSGEVLPGSASFTLDILGRQVRAPGYYDPNSATGGRPQMIFQNGTRGEDAIGRFSRRLSDAVRGGADPNDPNIIYRELARIRDDAMVALGLKADDPQLAAKLRAATGFVHLDRFIRGANGETGFTPAPGTQPGRPLGGATAPGTTPAATTPAAAPGTAAAPAAPGGNNVSATPGLDPGTGGGGTVPGQTPGAGAADPLRNQALANNQALRTALLLDKLGLGSPMARRNMFTGPVGEQLAGLMDPWMRTQGLQGGDPAANYEGMIGKLAGYFGQGGGGISSIAGDARTAAQQAAADPRYAQGMDADLLAMLTGFNQLATQGQNPWLQKAYGTLRDDLAAQYSQYNLQPGNLGNVDLLGFIQKNPLFNFMTGR